MAPESPNLINLATGEVHDVIAAPTSRRPVVNPQTHAVRTIRRPFPKEMSAARRETIAAERCGDVVEEGGAFFLDTYQVLSQSRHIRRQMDRNAGVPLSGRQLRKQRKAMQRLAAARQRAGAAARAASDAGEGSPTQEVA